MYACKKEKQENDSAQQNSSREVTHQNQATNHYGERKHNEEVFLLVVLISDSAQQIANYQNKQRRGDRLP